MLYKSNYRSYTIYYIYCRETDVIRRDCFNFANYMTKEMGPPFPKPVSRYNMRLTNFILFMQVVTLCNTGV